MSEGHEEITVKVKYDPNKDDTIDVKISPNGTVSEFEEKVQNTLGNLNDVPMGILKFNEQELDDKNKTLKDLGIKDGSEIENENRVLIETLTGKPIYITCDENTTVREFLKKLKYKEPKLDYIRLMYKDNALFRPILDQKLLDCQIGKKSIKYGAILKLVVRSEASKNSESVFDLNNLEESKNSNLVKVSETLKTDNNVFNLGRLDNNPRISSDSKKESKNSNYHPFRIIVGIADLLLFAAAVTTFLLFFLSSLSLSIAIPIVLAALFVTFAVLFLGWSTILPKGCLKKINSGADLGKEKENDYEIDENENNQKDDPEEEKKDEEEEVYD